MELSELNKTVRDSISSGLTEKAFDLLQKVIDNEFPNLEISDSEADAFVLIKKKYADIRKMEIEGRVTYDDVFALQAQVCNSLLSLTKKITSKPIEQIRIDNTPNDKNELSIVEVQISGSLDNYSSEDREKFISGISTILSIPKTEVRILRVSSGSIILILEMKKIYFSQLETLYKLGLLNFLGIESITLEEDYEGKVEILYEILDDIYTALEDKYKGEPNNLFKNLKYELISRNLNKVYFQLLDKQIKILEEDNIYYHTKMILRYLMRLVDNQQSIIRMAFSADTNIWHQKNNHHFNELVSLQKRFIQNGGKVIYLLKYSEDNTNLKEIIEFYRPIGVTIYPIKVDKEMLSTDFLYLSDQLLVINWLKNSTNTELISMEISQERNVFESIQFKWENLYLVASEQLKINKNDEFKKNRL